MLRHPLQLSIGPDDLLVIEGVCALMDQRLRALADRLVYVQAPEALRLIRVQADYIWRGRSEADVQRMLASRELDEHREVSASQQHAHIVISSEPSP